MARDVEADVEINDKSSRGLRSFLAGLRQADRQVKETRKGIDQASESTGKFSKSADENAKAISRLSRELEISKNELGSLARAFANAGTTAERSDIAKAMRKQQAEIRGLTKNRDILKDLLPTEEIPRQVQSFGRRFTSELSKTLSAVSESAGPVLATVLAASAPAIGATISGAIIGGAGLGGVVGGFLLAAQDTRVQNAMDLMKSRVGRELQFAAEPFVATTIKGIGQIERALDDIDFDQIFADSAKNVQPVIDGITEAVEELGGAVGDLIHHSGPAVREIGREVGAFAGIVAGGLDSLSDNSKEGADALGNLFTIINLGTASVFGLVNGLTEIYGWLRKISGGGLIDTVRGIADAHASVAGKATSVAEGFVQEAGAAGQLGGSIGAATISLDAFKTAIDDAYTSAQSLFDATTNVGAATDAVTAAAKKNGNTIDANTTKGRANRDALSGLVTALNNNFTAFVKVNGEGRAANQVAKDNETAFYKAAAQLKITGTRAHDLAVKLGLIPPKKDVHIKTNADQARDDVNRVHTALANLTDKTVKIHIKSVRDKVDNTLARLNGAFDATSYFAAAGAGDGIRRAGGASPVQVDNTTNVTVLLDGREIRAVARVEAKAEVDRASHRQKVGKR